MNDQATRNPARRIRLAIAGIGNCASSLVQGISYYSQTGRPTNGLITPVVGGYRPSDIDIVAAFDVDRRKVGRRLEQAIFAEPNCTLIFEPNPLPSEILVQMAPPLDGVGEHMAAFPEADGFRLDDANPVDVANVLAKTRADVLVCYVPVGAELAARHYAMACLAAGVAFVNAMPAFIASDESWAQQFSAAGLPIIGDDVKSQVGATILHRTLARLLEERGCGIGRTFQLNFGGNTDFSNMLDRSRVTSKKVSKTRAVRAEIATPIEPRNIHIGPSDHVPWLRDNKIAYIHLDGWGFGGAPIEIEVKLSVEDSPNSAAVVLDAVRCAKLGLDRGLAGPLIGPCAYFMKSPPQEVPDAEARALLAAFLDA